MTNNQAFNERYQVWYGMAIARFEKREDAQTFAFENDGIVVDTIEGEVVPMPPKVTHIEYWVRVNEGTYMATPAITVAELLAQGYRGLDIRVSPAK